MKDLKLKDLKPVMKQDKLLNELIRTSKSYEIYSVTHDPATDKPNQDKHYDPKDYE